MFSTKYSRNIGAISESEMSLLQTKRIFIAGCGGLGGNLLSYFLRIGIGSITIVDGDTFDVSNLNRQMFCTETTIGQPKVVAAQKAARQINPDVSVKAIHTLLDHDNCDKLITGHDLIIDALDNIESRRVLAASCQNQNIPLIYGAICGWVAQISILTPQTAVSALNRLYPEASVLQDKSCLSFTPAVCAGIQAAEAVKLLLNKDSELKNHILYVDLLDNEFELLPLF